MKYKVKLWDGEPEENSFKMGDRAIGYGSDAYSLEADVTSVDGNYVFLASNQYHFRQCRLVEQEKLEEWEVVRSPDKNRNEIASLYWAEQQGWEHSKPFKVREVLE